LNNYGVLECSREYNCIVAFVLEQEFHCWWLTWKQNYLELYIFLCVRAKALTYWVVAIKLALYLLKLLIFVINNPSLFNSLSSSQYSQWNHIYRVVGMQLTEKYEENFDVSSEGPSSGVTRPPEYKLPVYKPTIYNAQAITGHMSSSVYKPLRLRV
jgi:hypothetical protein